MRGKARTESNDSAGRLTINVLRKLSNMKLQGLLCSLEPAMSCFRVTNGTRETVIAILIVSLLDLQDRMQEKGWVIERS